MSGIFHHFQSKPFSECTRGPGQAGNNAWLNQKMLATVGERGELVIDTSRYISQT